MCWNYKSQQRIHRMEFEERQAGLESGLPDLFLQADVCAILVWLSKFCVSDVLFLPQGWETTNFTRSARRPRQLSNCIGHNPRRQHLGKHLRLALPRSIERVGRDTAAAEGGQGLRNGLVVAGPVGAQQGDVCSLEGLLHLRLIQSYALVYLAAQAPRCGKVHEDRAALGLISH